MLRRTFLKVCSVAPFILTVPSRTEWVFHDKHDEILLESVPNRIVCRGLNSDDAIVTILRAYNNSRKVQCCIRYDYELDWYIHTGQTVSHKGNSPFIFCDSRDKLILTSHSNSWLGPVEKVIMSIRG